MNFSYFRKSRFSKEETLKKLHETANQRKLSIIGETSLTNTKGTLVHVCDTSFVDSILKNDKNLLGLLSTSILILEKDNEIFIGIGNPSLLGGVTDNTDIQLLALSAEETARDLINEVSGAGEQKVQNIKLYSTTTCPYCIMEKQWLESNKITHEIVYIDKDQKEAEKLVRITGQMGVPVTEVQYEDGDQEYIVGFNKPQLAKTLKV